MMYVVSLFKIVILFVVMDVIENKELKEIVEIKKDMRFMISKFDNVVLIWMIDRLGYEKIEEVMMSLKYEFYSKKYGGGIWVGKCYGKGGEINREFLKNLSYVVLVI